MVNIEWPKQLFIWYNQLYLISNWAVFDLCEAELGLACDFHGFLKATIAASEQCSLNTVFNFVVHISVSRTNSTLFQRRTRIVLIW